MMIYIIYDGALWVRLCIKLPLRWCTRQSWCSQHFTHDPIRQPTPQPLMQPTLYTWSYIATVAYITTDYFKLHSCPTKWSLYCLNVLETWKQRFLDETEGGIFKEMIAVQRLVEGMWEEGTEKGGWLSKLKWLHHTTSGTATNCTTGTYCCGHNCCWYSHH